MTRARDLSEIVNSTGLSVDTDTLVVDSANNRVGIGTNSPISPLTIEGNGVLQYVESAQGGMITNEAAGTTASVTGHAMRYRQNVGLGFHAWDTSPSTTAGQAVTYDEYMRINNAGSVTMNSDGSVASLDGVRGLQIGNSGQGSAGLALETLNRGYLMYINGTSLSFWDSTDNIERMRIDSNGQVGIGYTPDAWSTSLDVIQIGTARGSSVVAGTSGYSVNNHLFMTNNGYAGNEWYYTNNTTALQYYLEGTGNHIWNYAAAGVVGETTTIVSGRKYEITSGTPSPDLTGFGATTNNVGEVFIATGNTTITGGAVTQAILWNEAMRIDASGSLLHGTTDSSIYNATTGDGVNIKGQQGQIIIAKNATSSADPALWLNNTGIDGAIVTFAKDGISVGSIGVEAGDNFYIADSAGNSGLNFKGFVNPVGSNGETRDAAIDLGNPTGRFKDLYLSNESRVSGSARGRIENFYVGGSGRTFTITGGSNGALAELEFTASNHVGYVRKYYHCHNASGFWTVTERESSTSGTTQTVTISNNGTATVTVNVTSSTGSFSGGVLNYKMKYEFISVA